MELKWQPSVLLLQVILCLQSSHFTFSYHLHNTITCVSAMSGSAAIMKHTSQTSVSSRMQSIICAKYNKAKLREDLGLGRTDRFPRKFKESLVSLVTLHWSGFEYLHGVLNPWVDFHEDAFDNLSVVINHRPIYMWPVLFATDWCSSRNFRAKSTREVFAK